MSDTNDPKSGFKIYRASDAKGLMECMTMAPMTDVRRAGIKKLVAAGYMEGDEVQVLVDLPGFSLTRAWLKKNYSLNLRSHDSDRLYYIVAGNLKLGTEVLGPRDCFFVPANVPYTYRPGPEGVEVLEFRHAGAFNFVNLAKSASYYDRAADVIAANLADWKAARPPAVNA